MRLVDPLMWVAEHFQDFTCESRTATATDVPRRKHRARRRAGHRVRAGRSRAATPCCRHRSSQFDGTRRARDVDADADERQGDDQGRRAPVAARRIRRSRTTRSTSTTTSAAPTNKGEVWAEGRRRRADSWSSAIRPAPRATRPAGSSHPSLEIAGLSRSKGTVGDLARTATGDFDPTAFLGSALPKLFGLVPLDRAARAPSASISTTRRTWCRRHSTASRASWPTSSERSRRRRTPSTMPSRFVDRAQENAAKLIADGRPALAERADRQRSSGADDGDRSAGQPSISGRHDVLDAIASVAEGTEAAGRWPRLQNPLQAMTRRHRSRCGPPPRSCRRSSATG